jgi:hypothetical protein
MQAGRGLVPLVRLELQPKDLMDIHEPERILLLQLSVVLNEINILNKLLVFSNQQLSDQVLREAQNSQTYFLLTILAGKLFESYKVIKQDYFGTRLSREYNDLLTDDGRSALDKLKTYFSRSKNAVEILRNKAVFHYDDDLLREGIKATPDDEHLEMYFSEYTGNCFFYLGNVMYSNAVLDRIDPTDPYKAMDLLMGEILSTASLVLDFAKSCLSAVVSKHLKHLRGRPIEVAAENHSLIKLPYFVAR